MEQGNRIMGTKPQLKNSKIQFHGQNNILYCEDNVVLVNSELTFNGDNALIYLGSNRHEYKLAVSINHDCVFYMGRDNYMNGVLHAILSEQKHIIIGNQGLFSFGIWMRNADPHLIYDTITKERLNDTRSIYIGDHVWIGQSAMLLKGTQIGNGSIIGAMSVVSNKRLPANTVGGVIHAAS